MNTMRTKDLQCPHTHEQLATTALQRVSHPSTKQIDDICFVNNNDHANSLAHVLLLAADTTPFGSSVLLGGLGDAAACPATLAASLSLTARASTTAIARVVSARLVRRQAQVRRENRTRVERCVLVRGRVGGSRRSRLRGSNDGRRRRGGTSSSDGHAGRGTRGEDEDKRSLGRGHL